jgi:hypothetical protein
MIKRSGARITATVAVAGAAAVQLVGCTMTTEHGTAKNYVVADATANYVADYVAKYSPARVRPTDVSCPSGLEAKVGAEFDCHFTGPDGKYTAHLKIKSVEGTRIDYETNTYRS